MTEPEASTSDKPEVKEETSTTEKPTPGVFGSGFTTQEGGFAGFTGVTPPEKKGDGDAAAPAGDDVEEECKAEFTPIVQLSKVETNTGEEDEECLVEMKCKMYRFDGDAKEWKERGVGQAKFLKNKDTQMTRFLMRQDKTLKIRANHVIMPGTTIATHGGNEKAWVWSAMDFADETHKYEMLAIRFGTVERAQEFKAQYEKSMAENEPLLKDAPVAAVTPDVKEKDAEGDAAADALADKVAEASVA